MLNATYLEKTSHGELIRFPSLAHEVLTTVHYIGYNFHLGHSDENKLKRYDVD